MLKLLTQNSTSNKKPVNWQGLLADIILTALLSGPIAAPFLAKSGLFPLNFIASIIYFMGGVVCPQPEMSLMIASPNLMAVCMRCYGLLLALLTTRLLYAQNRGQGWYWLSQYRFTGATIASVLICAYLGEMLAQIFQLWSYNNWIVTSFGYVTGLGIGLFFAPVLYRESRH
ncbi:conserved membrane hypothetical protein [Hyella patelloides LEGE 07179]|uniref:DUF2085 domain-containing protein n=1 Tax=Hyella patelloides LEGE 07179 TaxID=945734 RepID=A0A563VP29_9CYAN|nr:DUF2085 domain-containing protein [Hyella patelloides]VEP13129.1 conserved membrane hypothetical protein [Hyella patelloides LEGE 07179]